MEPDTAQASLEKATQVEHGTSPSLPQSSEGTGPHGSGQQATRLDSHMSRHTYHGHRRESFTTKDIDELTELRARRESADDPLPFAAAGCPGNDGKS